MRKLRAGQDVDNPSNILQSVKRSCPHTLRDCTLHPFQTGVSKYLCGFSTAAPGGPIALGAARTHSERHPALESSVCLEAGQTESKVAQRGEMASLRPCSRSVAELGQNPGVLTPSPVPEPGGFAASPVPWNLMGEKSVALGVTSVIPGVSVSVLGLPSKDCTGLTTCS